MPELPPGEVHVWQVDLAVSADEMESLWRTLSPDERERAQRYHFERDRRRFVVARAMLRTLLAGYLDGRAEQLHFDYTAYGKPHLADATTGVQFNVSHSQELALIAVARGRRVGVDIEWVRADLASEDIAERFFSDREARALRALPPAERPNGFFRCWTRKEAFVKARGEGLSLPLDRFDVDVAPGAASALLATRPDATEARRWLLQDLAASANYFAAVAAEGRDWSLRRFCLQGARSAP